MTQATGLAASVHGEGYTHTAGWQGDMRVAIAHSQAWATRQRRATRCSQWAVL